MSTIEFIPVANLACNPVFGFIQTKQVSSIEYLDHHKKKKYKDYWNKFHFRKLIEYGLPKYAIESIFKTFNELKEIDSQVFHEFHKGNPYYYLGISYFMVQDYASAVYFINAAAKEDLELKPEANYKSPAIWFIELDSKPEKQAGRFIVSQAEKEMKKLLESYEKIIINSSVNIKILTLPLLRAKLLSKAVNKEKQEYQTIATTLISYVLEYNNRIETLRILDSLESIEPFVFHLFKGCVLLESIIRENPNKNEKFTSDDTLGDLIQKVYEELEIPHNISFKAKNLQEIINSLPNQELALKDTFSISGRVRNKTGHSLEWKIKINETQYKKLYQAIGIACLHCVNLLY